MSLFDRFKKALGSNSAKPDPLPPAPPYQLEPEPEPLRVPEVEPEALKAELSAGQAPLLLDVRRSSDYVLDHVPGAVSLPLENLPAKLAELDKSADIVVYCYQGYTSLDAAGYLIENGFQHVRSLKGGITLWRVRGGPLAEKYKSARL